MENTTKSSEKKDKITKPEGAFTQDDKNNAKEIYNNLKTGDVIKCWIKATSVDKNYNNDEKMKNVYIPVLYVVYQGPIQDNEGKIVKKAFVFKINSKSSHDYECKLNNDQYTNLHNQISYVSVTGQSLKIDDIAQMGKLEPRLSLGTLKSMACALTEFAKENEQQCNLYKDNELEKLKYEVKAQYARMECQFLNDYVEKAKLRQEIEQQQKDLDRKERIIEQQKSKINFLQKQLNEERTRNRDRSRSRDREIENERHYDNNNNFRYNNDYRGRNGGGYRGEYQQNNYGGQYNQYLNKQSNNCGSQYNQNYQGRGRGGRGGYNY